MRMNVGDKPPTGFPAGIWGELAVRPARKQSALPPCRPVSGLAKVSPASPSRVLVQGIQWLCEARAGACMATLPSLTVAGAAQVRPSTHDAWHPPASR